MISRFSRVRLCATLWTAGQPGTSVDGILSKNTGVGCHFLLLLAPGASPKQLVSSKPAKERSQSFVTCSQKWHLSMLLYSVVDFTQVEEVVTSSVYREVRSPRVVLEPPSLPSSFPPSVLFYLCTFLSFRLSVTYLFSAETDPNLCMPPLSLCVPQPSLHYLVDAQ